MESRIAPDPSQFTSAAQIRAARAMLGWTREQAAEHCRVGVATLARFEREEGNLGARTIADVVRTFEENGIVFFNDDRGEGVARAIRANAPST